MQKTTVLKRTAAAKTPVNQVLARRWRTINTLYQNGMIEDWRMEVIQSTAELYTGKTKEDYLLRVIGWVRKQGEGVK